MPSRVPRPSTTWSTPSATAPTGWNGSRRPPATSATLPRPQGVRRIVYLGGLGDDDAQLSPHLASRHDVGRVLAAGPVPVTELRAAIIIGSGSASFEMLRYLVEVLPAMITPKWVDTRCQPIAVRDVLRYLVESLREPSTAARVLEIGGPDVISYREMMNLYSDAAGLRRRLIIPVPVLSPRLSSHWVGLVTPLPVALSRPLVASLINEVVVHDPVATELMPGPLFTTRQAIDAALARVHEGAVVTRWDSAELQGRPPAEPMPTDPSWAGGTVLSDERTATTSAPSDAVFAALCRLGGDRGWHSNGWLWGVRGAIDTLIGGVGMRRGRRDPDRLARGRRPRLLEGRGARGRSAPAAAGRDEAARRGLAGVAGRADTHRLSRAPARPLPPPRAVRPSVLAGRCALPPLRVPGPAARHHP